MYRTHTSWTDVRKKRANKLLTEMRQTPAGLLWLFLAHRLRSGFHEAPSADLWSFSSQAAAPGTRSFGLVMRLMTPVILGTKSYTVQTGRSKVKLWLASACAPPGRQKRWMIDENVASSFIFCEIRMWQKSHRGQILTQFQEFITVLFFSPFLFLFQHLHRCLLGFTTTADWETQTFMSGDSGMVQVKAVFFFSFFLFSLFSSYFLRC